MVEELGAALVVSALHRWILNDHLRASYLPIAYSRTQGVLDNICLEKMYEIIGFTGGDPRTL